MQGGDFGKAGRRTYGEMTVPHLRKLLEDDVEDLAKRALCPEVSVPSTEISRPCTSSCVPSTEIPHPSTYLAALEG